MRRRNITALLRHKFVVVGTSVAALIIVVAVLAPVITSVGPNEIDPANAVKRPSVEHWFGTDQFGRDVFSRVVYGARLSLRIGFVVTLSTIIGGAILGLLAGYLPHLDNLIMRLVDAMLALPVIVLALAIVAVLGPSEFGCITALVIGYIPRTARIVRGEVLSVREQPYVEASRAIGSSRGRIILKDILPNCLSVLLVQATFVFAYAVLSEAGLSFLGAGPPPPTPSWGNIMSEGRALLRSAPWIVFFPGIAITLTVLGINLLGDGIRDATDPRL